MSLKIIIIANGPNALDFKAGKLIDSFDIVIRMNCYQIEGYEEHIGSKTDVWVTTNDFDRFISEYDNLLEKRKVNSFLENWTTDTKDVETFVEKHKIKCDEIHFINMWIAFTIGHVFKDNVLYENNVCLETFDSGVMRSLPRGCKININGARRTIRLGDGRNLSTGMHTLVYAIYRWIGEDIYIHGFDFFKSGKEYFSTPENVWEMRHAAETEEIIVNKWVEAGIIKFFTGEKNE